MKKKDEKINSEQNSQEKQKEQKKKLTKKELEDITNLFSGKKTKKGSRKKGNSVRIFSWRINPIVLIVSIFLFGFLLLGLFNRTGNESDQTTLDTIVKGLKENRYSQIFLQNDGKVVANEKRFLLLDSSDDVSFTIPQDVDLTVSEDFEEKEISDLVGELTEQDLVDQLRALFSSDSDNITKIIIGSDFLIADRSGDSKDWLIRDIRKNQFEQTDFCEYL